MAASDVSLSRSTSSAGVSSASGTSSPASRARTDSSYSSSSATSVENNLLLHTQSVGCPQGSKRRLLTRSQLAERIARGETLVLHSDKIYKLDSWLACHPGGALAILHFVGRDASDEIEAYHSDETLRRMQSFVIGHLDLENAPRYKPLVPPVQLGYRKGKGLDHPHAQLDTWQLYVERQQAKIGERFTATARPQDFPLPTGLLEPPEDPPAVDPARHAAISRAYKRMHEQVKAAGLYRLRPAGYAREVARYTILAALASYLYAYAQGRAAFYLLSSFFLGLFWHQLTFTAHDSGHCGITHSHSIDHIIGTIIANFIGGLSIGWWCDNHDVHHLVTNHPEHDPDIQHLPFFAISPKFLVWQRDAPDSKAQDDVTIGLWSSYYRRVLAFDAASRLFLRLQHKVYYVVMSLGRFNLYANSWGFLLLKARRDRWFYLELLGLAVWVRWFVFGVLRGLPTWKLRLAYVLISHIVTSPLHVQIVLSHYAQSSEDLGLNESFASRQIRTTMDVSCPSYLDFLHGGLHMQVSHHLFPRIPRHNLRQVRDDFVRPFAKEWGLEYEEFTFAKGNSRVLRVLQDVANQVEIFSKVAQAQARGEMQH